MPNVCFCADDYALTPQISQAILALVERGALHATSCMTQSPFWPSDAAQLKHYQGKIDIGLHFNLTHAFDAPTYQFPLSQLMLRAWTRQLDKKAIRATLEQQWQKFIDAMGQQPDFVDGHQHVHQFPVVRDILIDFLKEQEFKGWVRSLSKTVNIAPYQFKSQLLQLLGAQRLSTLCQQANFPQNEQFAGIYDFSKTDYQQLCQQWLAHAEQQLLIMCHPSLPQSAIVDSIQQARVHEYNYFISDQFFQDCSNNHIQLSRIGSSHV